jgi:triacylglycerol esterase/lipase EstA (alpha/beta hydrolase family)
MTNNHTVPVDVSFGKNSQAFFAYDQPKACVIFVHGFNGTAIGTWNDFPDFLTTDSSFKEIDFVFYGYGSLDASASFNAVAFKEFLIGMTAPKNNGILPQSQELPERNYEKMYLVAHSLGALIVRRAILSLCNNNNPWIDKISLVLFAPAHTGARIQKLAKEVLSGLTSLLPSFMGYQYPVYQDLEPNSLFINKLIEDTNALLQQNKGKCNIAKKIVWGEKDRVVTQINFCSDPDAELVYHKGHINICKPDNVYIKPIEILKDALR